MYVRLTGQLPASSLGLRGDSAAGPDVPTVEYHPGDLNWPSWRFRSSWLAAPAEQGIGIFAGLGGLNSVEALDAGAQGLIPGCELSEHWLSLYQAHGSGDRQRALEMYRRVVPLIAFMMQSLDFGIACSKELLRGKGILGSAALRTASPLGSWSLIVLREHARAIDAAEVVVAQDPSRD